MRIWLGAFLLALGGAAQAADWTVVHTSPEGDLYYYDASKLAINGNEITYWKKVLFKTPHPYKSQFATSALYRERIQCSEHTVKPLSHVVNSTTGTVIEQVSTEGETTAIVPDTVGDVFETTLCPLVRAKAANANPAEKAEPKREAAPLVLPPLPGLPGAVKPDNDYPPGTL